MKTKQKHTKVISMAAKVFFYFVLSISSNTAYSQTNTLPQNGNVGIGTTSPTSRLQVNGSAMIDSSLTVRDSLVIQNGARIQEALKVDGDLIIESNAFIEKDLTVKGSSRFTHDIIVEEGDLKLESIRDTTVEEDGLLMIKKNGDVVNGGVLKDIMYMEVLPAVQCLQDLSGNIIYRSPYWEANVENGMFLLKKDCMKEVRLGVGIKPTAKFHLLSPKITTTLPLLIERSSGNQSPSYKLMQLDNEGLLYAREVKVNLQAWPDYVFHKEYKLMPLSEVEAFITENGHLPAVPKAEVIEEGGLNLGEMNKILMLKVEELTLYLIEQQKIIEDQQKSIEVLKTKTQKL